MILDKIYCSYYFQNSFWVTMIGNYSDPLYMK